MGGAIVQHQAIWAANNVSDGMFVDGAIDGFMGLGFDPGNSGKVLLFEIIMYTSAHKTRISPAFNPLKDSKLTNSLVQPTPQKTFFSNLRSSLPNPLFTASLNHAAPGYYTFGYIPAAYTPSSFTYRPVLRTPNHGWWGVNVTGWSFDCHSDSDYKPTTTPLSLHAIVDTGTTAILLPPGICKTYYAGVPGAVNDEELGYMFPCNETLPALNLDIGGYEARIPGELMNGGVADGKRMFTLAYFIDGFLFFRNIFHFSNLQLQFSRFYVLN